MTEKEKAEAYDKAIERAKKLYGNGIAEEIFTELKESEDERIKKAIIEFFESEDDNTTYSLVRKKDIIDWLEKQGEQKPTLPKWKYKKDNTPLLRDSIILNKYGGVAKSPSGAIVSDAWVLDYDELAKPPKEEKIEPKFKVGDWIISSVLGTARIIGVNDSNEFQLEYIDGKQEFSSIDYVNYAYDKWTIEDVRDGDILACNEEILLFKSYSAQGRISLYCWYNGQTNNFHSKKVIDILLTTTNKVCPATKEQRDALMKAMNDAGYEWDADKKELKKLDLVPNKKPILEGLNMKTYNDVNIGDTVYIWGTSDSSVDETTITEKYDDRGHWNLKFSNGCVGRALKNGTSSTMGMYACLVYSDKEAVRESINERIKILSNIKI